MLEFEVPNLDAESPAELDAFAGVCKTLAEYAKHKAEAIRQRTNGQIPGAMKHERDCDVIYCNLPEWAQW